MSKETKEKVANAFRAMKSIGISEDKIKPVLKSLLKLFDKNWTLIEQENYRALADAIFERDKVEAAECSRKILNSEAAEHPKKIVNSEKEDCLEEETRASEEPERPLKRLRHRNRDGQTSSSSTSNSNVPKTPLVKPKEPGELPEGHLPKENGSHSIADPVDTCQSLGVNKQEQHNSAKSLIVDENYDPCQLSNIGRIQQNTPLATERRSLSHPMRPRDRGKGSVSAQSGEKSAVSGSSSDVACLKDPNNKCGIVLSPLPKQKSNANHTLIKPKDEPITDDTPCPVFPVAKVHPGDRLNLAKLRSREKVSGRPLPWSGQKGRGDARDVLTTPSLPGSGGPLALSRESRDSGSRGRQGQDALGLDESHSKGIGADDRRDSGKRMVEEGNKTKALSTSGLSKRSREDPSSLVGRSGPHPLLLDGVNQKGAESFWDSSDFGIGLRRGAKIVGDHDMVHLIPRSSTTLYQSIALSSCQTLSAVRALQAQEEKFRADEAQLRKYLAQLKGDVERLEASDARLKEKNRLLELENAGLKDELRPWPERLEVKNKEGEDLRNELRILYDKNYKEALTGEHFLSSPAGLEYQSSLAEKSVDAYRTSSAFEDEVYRRAYTIHDEVVLDARRILRQRLVPEEVVLLIGPGVPDIDESVFDAPVGGPSLDDFGDIEIIEALSSLHGDGVSVDP